MFRDAELYRKVDGITEKLSENTGCLGRIETAIKGLIELNNEKHKNCDDARADIKTALENLGKKEIKDTKGLHCRIDKSMLTTTKFILILAGLIVSLAIGVAAIVVGLRDSRDIGELQRLGLYDSSLNNTNGGD